MLILAESCIKLVLCQRSTCIHVHIVSDLQGEIATSNFLVSNKPALQQGCRDQQYQMIFEDQ